MVGSSSVENFHTSTSPSSSSPVGHLSPRSTWPPTTTTCPSRTQLLFLQTASLPFSSKCCATPSLPTFNRISATSTSCQGAITPSGRFKLTGLNHTIKPSTSSTGFLDNLPKAWDVMVYKDDQPLDEDEQLSPSFKNAVVLWALGKIDPCLPPKVMKDS